MTKNLRFPDANGTAALGICESLLLALTDAKILSEKDARDLVTTHQGAADASESPGKHQAVIAIVQRILAGKNGVRPSSVNCSKLLMQVSASMFSSASVTSQHPVFASPAERDLITVDHRACCATED